MSDPFGNPFDPAKNPEEHAIWERQAADTQTEQETGRRLYGTPASTMRMRTPHWLYDRRIPCSAITLLAGRQGIGKSTIAYNLAARITKGTLPGEYEGTPRSVGVVATEDAWSEVILPRLVAAGADLTRVHRLEALDENGLHDIVSVPADINRLAALCTRLEIILIMLDPLMSVIHGSIDTHKDREVRKALDPLTRLCTETGISVLGLIHVNKSNSNDPVNAVMASVAFTAVARSVLFAVADPEIPDDYLLGHVKCNIGREQPTLRYRLIDVKIEIDNPVDGDDAVVHTSRVVWDGEDDRLVRDVLEEGGRSQRPVGDQSAKILDWVTEQGRTVSLAEITEEFPKMNAVLIRQSLGRLVKRGDLNRVLRGHYVAPPKDRPLQTPPSL